MTGRTLRYVLASLMLLGLVARLVAYAAHPGLHPDEFFQYLEPAWWHTRGYGWPAWEWGAKLRSWIPPSYYGSWMVLLTWLGIGSGAAMHKFSCCIGPCCRWRTYGWAGGQAARWGRRRLRPAVSCLRDGQAD